MPEDFLASFISMKRQALNAYRAAKKSKVEGERFALMDTAFAHDIIARMYREDLLDYCRENKCTVKEYRTKMDSAPGFSVSYTDIFDYRYSGCILVCPVDAKGVVSKGLANKFKTRYPSLRPSNKTEGATYYEEDGLVTLVTTPLWGTPPEYEYIKEGLKALEHLCNSGKIQPEKTLVFPEIGSEEGGLGASAVKQMVREFSKNVFNLVYWSHQPEF